MAPTERQREALKGLGWTWEPDLQWFSEDKAYGRHTSRHIECCGKSWSLDEYDRDPEFHEDDEGPTLWVATTCEHLDDLIAFLVEKQPKP